MPEPLASWRDPPIASAKPLVIGDLEQRSAKAFASLPAMHGEKFVLRSLPKRPRLAVLRLAARGQDDPPLAPIVWPRLERDKAVPYERPQVVANRRAIRHERACQFGERRRPRRLLKLVQNRILRRAQTARPKRVVIELSEPARRFARRRDETFAHATIGRWRLRHGWLLFAADRGPVRGRETQPVQWRAQLPQDGCDAGLHFLGKNGHMPTSCKTCQRAVEGRVPLDLTGLRAALDLRDGAPVL